MKKKIISIISVVVVLVMTFAATVSAATPAMSAKKGLATVDGVINASEYGSKVTMNTANGYIFGGTNAKAATCPTIDFYFAWTATDLYIAFTSTDLKAGDAVQLCMNPGNIITGNAGTTANKKPGLFWTFWTVANSDALDVHRHNYQALAADQKDGSDIKVNATVTSKVVTTATSVTAELKIPFTTILVNDAKLGVNLSTFAPADAKTIGLALFTMRTVSEAGKDSNWTTAPHTLWNYTDVDGTLTLAAEGAAVVVPTNPTTADLGLVSMAVMAVASMVVLKKKK